MINTYIVLPWDKIQEDSSFTATIKFRLVDASTVPTTVRYRIDCTTTLKKIRDWTSLTPAASIDVIITPADNEIVSDARRRERRQITVETNTGLSTQTRERVWWNVHRIPEF